MLYNRQAQHQKLQIAEFVLHTLKINKLSENESEEQRIVIYHMIPRQNIN